ncbi:hypothetical protein D3C81_805920 [compost metagenome]
MQCRQPQQIDAGPACSLHDLVLGHVTNENARHLHSAGGNQRLNEVSQMLAHQPGQHVAPLGIDGAHRAHMRAEVAAFDEARQGQLRNRRAVPIQQGAGHGHGCHQLWRQHHVANAQAGEQRFGEGADVDRPRMRIEPLHASGGFSSVVKLAVVVVFDDPALACSGPFDDGQTPIQRQRRSGWELV